MAPPRFTDIRWLSSVDSTNRYLLDLAQAGAPEGVVVVADYQTRGRGRRDRIWEAPAGTGLLASILGRPVALAPQRRWLLTAAMALAAADACGPDVDVDVKWPNDLLIGAGKLGGILAEADAGAVVVGIGLNVSWCPPGAASLPPGTDRRQLLDRLLAFLEGWWDRWDDVFDAYTRRCVTVGRRVQVSLADGTVTGQAVGVEGDGALRVATDAGVEETFLVADVVHVTEP
jgi:BirA family biotin operon repressor/biotin-[acetyl-CoA-carboxylase] ligase